MTLAVTLALIQSLIALLRVQTDLLVAATTANPTDVGKLIQRFTEDTRWIHVALAWQNAHLCKALGETQAVSALDQPALNPHVMVASTFGGLSNAADGVAGVGAKQS